MKSFIRKLMWLTQRRRKDAELRQELQFHLEEEAEERREEGVSREQANWAARRDLGNVSLLQENVRAVWIWTFWERLLQDLRYAWRMMMANKAFSGLAILSLALGIGANTAIFSFMDSLLLRALPVSDPTSLAVLRWHARGRGGEDQRASQIMPVLQSMSGHFDNDAKTGLAGGIFPFPAFEVLRQQGGPVFSTLFAYYRAGTMHLTIKGEAELAGGEYVSGGYFGGLSVSPAAGRLILDEDDRAGAPPVVVISSALAARRFDGAANAPGQSILINNQPFTVVGVAPAEFFGVDPGSAPDFYLPLHSSLLLSEGHGWLAQAFLEPHLYWIEMMGRLRPGVSLAQAQAFLAPAFEQWVAGTATTDRERANLPKLALTEGAGGLDTLRRAYTKPLYVLLVLVGLILAIACANVANLLLARATARRSEIALRLSVGASRLRVVRQLLTESILLASLGGAVGILFAVWGIRFLARLLEAGETPFLLHPTLNWHALGVTAALSLLTGILFGLVPALQSTRVDVGPALKQVRSSEARTRVPLGLSRLLVISQITLSMLLLVAAGLFVRTLISLHSIDLGFNRENVLLFELNARQAGHHDPEISAFYADLRMRFSSIPGVRSASLSQSSLIGAGTGLPISPPGREPDENTRILFVGPDFFKTMQIPILVGRGIEASDRPGSQQVAVISELFAKVNFGDRNPLGQHLIMQDEGRDLQIVGVSRNARYGRLKHALPPVVYIPYDQGVPPPMQMVYALRTAGDPLALVNTVRQIVRKEDPRVPVSDVKTQVAEIDQTINQEITFARLCAALAVLALVMASVGLYGTMSYKVARRTGEIGIRMALGAQRGTVIWMVLSEVLLLAAAGLAIGIPTALAISSLIESFLFGMKPNDPLALIVAVAALLSAAVLAGYFPAWKASRIDPMIALRHE
jgi:macrolide transport system ATP-binding/permease protein